jgi:hypothetical protein
MVGYKKEEKKFAGFRMPLLVIASCIPRFFRVMSPTIPTAGGAGVVSQIGSGLDGWMLRVVTVLNVDHSRKTCGPVRQGEEVGSPVTVRACILF